MTRSTFRIIVLKAHVKALRQHSTRVTNVTKTLITTAKHATKETEQHKTPPTTTTNTPLVIIRGLFVLLTASFWCGCPLAHLRTLKGVRSVRASEAESPRTAWHTCFVRAGTFLALRLAHPVGIL